MISNKGEGQMSKNPSPKNHLHGGHVAILLGLLFWFFFILQPYIDPTPENLPTKNLKQTDIKKKETPIKNQNKKQR
tara:strand:- start:515 stop:742 length:228 start_codon:yes stop_codon:yes gene_type:complete